MGDVDTSYIKVGPVGSGSGTAWDEKGNSRIVQIFVSHDDEINGLQFQYAEDETLVQSEGHGSNEGYKFDVVKINYPTEYITWISGYKSSNSSNVCSITFGTNKGEHGPYGQFTDKDKSFNFWLGEGRQFAGFHGTADEHNIKSIGTYVKPVTSLDYFCKTVVKPAEEGVESWAILNDGRRIEDMF